MGPVQSEQRCALRSRALRSRALRSRAPRSRVLSSQAQLGCSYAGFGSLIVDDREKVTHKILDAVKETSLRLLLSK